MADRDIKCSKCGRLNITLREEGGTGTMMIPPPGTGIIVKNKEKKEYEVVCPGCGQRDLVSLPF